LGTTERRSTRLALGVAPRHDRRALIRFATRATHAEIGRLPMEQQRQQDAQGAGGGNAEDTVEQHDTQRVVAADRHRRECARPAQLDQPEVYRDRYQQSNRQA